MVISRGFGRGVCVGGGGGGGGGGVEYSGGSDIQRATYRERQTESDRQRASEERASASAVDGPPMHGQYILQGYT